ncbi:MAG: hypothetical protein K0R41_2370, partial [Geminicoccaceae bacterium]|nr:hypothetical protein [Geminicoccaceae bacterium]
MLCVTEPDCETLAEADALPKLKLVAVALAVAFCVIVAVLEQPKQMPAVMPSISLELSSMGWLSPATTASACSSISVSG